MKPGQFIIICLSLTAFFAPQKSEGQTISDTVNRYYKVIESIPSYASAVRVQDVTGLSSGDRVLIVQMKGATITTTNGPSFGNLLNTPTLGGAGKYEFATICSFLNDTVLFTRQLINTYDYNSSVQMVYVPVYSDVTVIGTLHARPWNPSTGLGGVIAIEATGTITMNADINANGVGYRGGTLFEFNNTTANYSCSNSFPADAYFYGTPPASVGTFDTRRVQHGAYKGEGIATIAAVNSTGMGKHTNGGGGGNNHNAGGGGGGNYGEGGNGGFQNVLTCSGNYFGIGGLPLESYSCSVTNNRIFMGGGGGSGHANNPEGTPGGNGGGIVFIKCAELIGNNRFISANGIQGINSSLAPDNPVNESRGDGGGGGGGGGTVLLDIATYTTTINIAAQGANGNNAGFQIQCPGPGGGGGGGVVWSSSALPGNVIANVTGGANGIVKISATHDPACEGFPNGATAGEVGTVQSGFVAPQGTNTIDCSILPLDLLKQFTGKRYGGSIQLNWTFTNVDNVQKVILERKAGNEQYRKITEQFNPSTVNGFYTDEETSSSVTYRLVVYSWNGERQYSNHVFFEAGIVRTFNLYPNPATNEVTIQLPINANGRAGIVVTDVIGRQVQTQQIMITASQTNTKLDLKDLPAGIYLLRLEIKGEVYSAKLIKQ